VRQPSAAVTDQRQPAAAAPHSRMYVPRWPRLIARDRSTAEKRGDSTITPVRSRLSDSPWRADSLASSAECSRRIRQGDERAAEELVRRYECEIRLEVRGWLRLRNPARRLVFDSMDTCQSVLAGFFARAAVGDFDLGVRHQRAVMEGGGRDPATARAGSSTRREEANAPRPGTWDRPIRVERRPGGWRRGAAARS